MNSLLTFFDALLRTVGKMEVTQVMLCLITYILHPLLGTLVLAVYLIHHWEDSEDE